MDRSIFLQLLPLSVENFKAEFGDNVIVNLSAYALNCCRELPNPCYVIIKNCSAYNDWNITTGARDGWGPGDGFQTWLSEKNSPSLYTVQCSPTIPGAVTVLSLKMLYFQLGRYSLLPSADVVIIKAKVWIIQIIHICICYCCQKMV